MAEWKDTEGTKWKDTKGVKWKDTIEISVEEQLSVKELVGAEVTEEQKGFLERIRKLILDFRLEKVTVVLPPIAFKFVRQKKKPKQKES